MTEILVPAVKPGTQDGDLWGASELAIPERFADRAAELADTVAEISRTLRTRLEEQLRADSGRLAVSEVSLSFSLELQAETGILVARASAAGTFTVTITWARGEKAEPGAPA